MNNEHVYVETHLPTNTYFLKYYRILQWIAMTWLVWEGASTVVPSVRHIPSHEYALVKHYALPR